MPAMNRRRRPGAADLDYRIRRFLRPGALAWLRDSRISAQSPKSKPSPLLRPSSPSTPRQQPPEEQIGGSPCFVARIYGPRFLQRKKLTAPKSLYFASPAVSSPAAPEPSDQVLDSIGGADLVAAH